MAGRAWCGFVFLLLSGCAAMAEEDDPGCEPVACMLDCHEAGRSRGTCITNICVCRGAVISDGGDGGDVARSDDGSPGADADADSGAEAEAAADADADADADVGRDDARDTPMEDDAGAMLSCSEFIDCATMCADDLCIGDCFERTCPAGMEQYESLVMCVETSCAAECDETGDPDVCNSCVYSSCDAEVTSCLSSGC